MSDNCDTHPLLTQTERLTQMPSSSARKPKSVSQRERKDGSGHGGDRKLGAKRKLKSKGKMGNPKLKWTPEEETALLAGVAKHGQGKWKRIIKDPDFSPFLTFRSNIDLKDKWRNLGPTVASTQKKRKSAKRDKLVRCPAPSALPPTGPSPVVVVVDNSKTRKRYNALIFEALSTLKDTNGSDVDAIGDFIQQKEEEPIPHNFRRLIAARLKSLVSRGKLEKTEIGFKIKQDIHPGTNAPSDLKTSTEEEDLGHIAACAVANAEGKSRMAAEAMEEFKIVMKLAEDTESMLLFVKEINEQCSSGEVVPLVEA